MVARKLTYMTCDGCGLDSRTFPDVPTTDVKRQLRQDGWRFRNGVHRCTECVSTALRNAQRQAQNPNEDTEQEDL